MAEPGRRDRVYRTLSIALLMLAAGGCAVLMLAFVVQVAVAAAAVGGILAMAMSFYVFVRLWPREDAPGPRADGPGAGAPRLQPMPMSPEEYRRQREKAQRLIREKAAPAMARAIRGLLLHDRTKRRK